MAVTNPPKTVMIAVSQEPEIEYYPIPVGCEYCGVVSLHPGGLCPSCGAASPAKLPNGVVVVSGLTGFSGVLPDSFMETLKEVINNANPRFVYGK